MNKLTVFVPFDGAREAVVSYFLNSGTIYLYDVTKLISTETVAPGSSDAHVLEVARSTAEDLLDAYSTIIDQDDSPYELTTDDGVQGFEVLFYTSTEEDFDLDLD